MVTKTPLSRGHIPLGAIQVCRFPQGGSFKAFASSDHFAKSLRLNKDLLVLTSELKEGSLLTGFDSPNETKDFLLSDLALTRNKDDASSLTDTPSKESESEAASNDISEEDLDEDLLNETYESGYQDRLGDIDLYALAPHDFDSPDSTFSRSLADLTDISLCEFWNALISCLLKFACVLLGRLFVRTCGCSPTLNQINLIVNFNL